jgi:cbb3-type cytochrome oxidase maturation protein
MRTLPIPAALAALLSSTARGAHDTLPPNPHGLDTATWIVIAAIVMFFVGALIALAWGARSGQFEDPEEAKYKMMDSDPEHPTGWSALERPPATEAPDGGRK